MKLYESSLAFFRRNAEFILCLEVAGNACFFIGSILFFFPAMEKAGIALFVAGSFGMLLGSISNAVKGHEKEKG